MLNTVKNPERMYDIIFEAVTEKREAVQETAKKCKQLFKQKNSSADFEVLTQLEELLRARQDEQAVRKHLESSKPGASPEALAKLKKLAEKKREDYKYYIKDFLPQLKKEITQSKKLDPTKRVEIEKIIMELITLDAVSKNDNKDHSDSTMQNQNTTAGAIEVPSGANTSKLSSGSDLDSGIDSPRTSKESLKSPVSSRRSSVSSILSSAEENNNLQKENENQMQPEQAATEEPKMQENSGGQADPDQVKEELNLNGEESGSTLLEEGELKLEKKEKETVANKQEAPGNNNQVKKQPDGRNLHVALAAGCTLLAIGCVVAGAMTSGLVGAGLLAMAAVFAIAAAVTWYLTPSSELTSTNLSRPVDDKELTACSQR